MAGLSRSRLTEGARLARKLRRLLPDPAFRRGLRHGVAAAIEHDEVRFGHDFRTVLDVGAHTGQFALFAARRFPGASIVAFEPLAPARERLSAVMAGRPAVDIHPYAVGATAGRTQLHVTHRDDSSSLLAVTDRATEIFPGTTEVATVEIATVRLDEAVEPASLDRPALLKIDVQGYELEVLRGAERLLDHIDEILVEVSYLELYEGQPLAGEVVSHLHGREFLLEGVYGQTRDGTGRALQADFLFGRAAR